MPVYRFKCESCNYAGKVSVTEQYFPVYEAIVNPKCPHCGGEMANKTTTMVSLTDLLLEEKLLTKEQLEDARDRQLGAKKPIHEVIVNMGFLTEDKLMAVASRAYSLPVVDLNNEKADSQVLQLLTYEQVKRYGVFPLRIEQGELVVAMSDPLDLVTLDDMRVLTKMGIRPVLSTKSNISHFIEEFYAIDDDTYDFVKNIGDDLNVVPIEEDGEEKGLFEVEATGMDKSLAVRLTNFVLSEAVKLKASDIHVEPYEKFIEIRFRIDGILKSIKKFPVGISRLIIARIKALSQMDISETRKPQDGRSKVEIGEKKVDLRISIIPTYFGEKIVIRLLDYSQTRKTIESLGFQGSELKLFKESIRKPQGIVLITGPTGSGKTSTIYAALNAIKSEAVNVITIEDPIEYLMEGVNQIQVNPYKDVTFAKGLRSILRQDPNVIFIGEIRDSETAGIAFRAALTGHLVFSTLHTNSAIASIVRLQDVGLDLHIIASSLISVIAQRLVRVICPHCKQPYRPNNDIIEKFKLFIEKHDVLQFYKGNGCEKCNYSGYSGRTAIFEILKNDERIQSLISNKASEKEILNEARKSGFMTLSEAGVVKVSQGLTTLDEVERISEVGWQEDDSKKEKVLPPSASAGKLLRILVVDDEDDIRKVICKRLKDAGYEVLQARTGKEALACAFRENPDLIIMDVMMPEMDGLEATKKIRANLQTVSIPVIMLTAKQDKHSELAGLDAGADDYIAKPFDGNKLITRIRMLLQRAQ